MSDALRMTPRPEHPRPDFTRDTFFNLNGTWDFAFDDQDVGICENWQTKTAFDQKIIVPFAYQTELSGIGTEEIHPIMWYRRSFVVPSEMRAKRLLLRFGAVDYSCIVFVNGVRVGEHKGGYSPFALDITHALQDGDNNLCLRVQDDPDCTQPRGKQYWKDGLMGCWYTPTSGIWQTVYLEAVGAYALKQIHITPDIDNSRAIAEMALDRMPQEALKFELELSFKGEVQKRITVDSVDRQIRVPIDMIVRGDLDPVRLWSPQRPNLYDLTVRVYAGDEQVDCVKTYFGMRKVHVQEGVIMLNNSPLYQRLILDQGYWPQSMLTPPSDEAIKKDIELTLAMGFNGARKHQKPEDPRYYYWADKMGLLVWEEMPSSYDFADEAVENFATTFLQAIDRDFNHPCIIAWVPINESWGVRQIYANKRQQDTARMLYYVGKAADGTRLISSNDGWEQVITDICALHDYAADKQVLDYHFADRAQVERTTNDWRLAYADSHTPTGKEAFMVTEFGGIAMSAVGIQGEMGGMETWGYHDKVKDEASFFERFEAVMEAVKQIPYNQGYCYTQLTDVQQEINGLLTPEREPKVSVERIRQINVNPFGRTNSN